MADAEAKVEEMKTEEVPPSDAKTEEPPVKRAKSSDGEKRKIGFGIVGCGMGSVTHAWALQRMDGVEFVAAYGRSDEKAKAFAEKWGAKRHYSDFAAFCADKEIDAVVICVPNSLHAEFAVPCAKAGKHLVVEKPLDTTLEKGLQIFKACEEAGVVLTGIYQMRFCQATKKINEAITSGRLGRLIHCDVYDKELRDETYYGKDGDHWWAGQKSLAGGGCLTTQASHVLDLMTHFMGDADTVFAKARTAGVHDISVEDLCSALVTFKSGATATVTAATCIKPAFKHRIEVHGTKGTVMMNGEYDKIVFWDVEGEEKIDDLGSFGITDICDPHGFPMDRHIQNLEDFVNAVRSGGKEKPMLDGAEFLKSEVFRFAVYESAQTGKEVKIDYSQASTTVA
jgi:predicted dehydrogenase